MIITTKKTRAEVKIQQNTLIIQQIKKTTVLVRKKLTTSKLCCQLPLILITMELNSQEEHLEPEDNNPPPSTIVINSFHHSIAFFNEGIQVPAPLSSSIDGRYENQKNNNEVRSPEEADNDIKEQTNNSSH
jgi:hypothetical protein